MRGAAGLFDVSHMGEIEVRGPSAAAACQRLDHQRRRVASPTGSAQYTLLCRDGRRRRRRRDVYRRAADALLLLRERRRTSRRTSRGSERARRRRDGHRSQRRRPRCSRCRGRARRASSRASTPLDARRRCARFRFASGEVAGVPALVVAHRLHRRGRLRALRRRRATPRRCGRRSSTAGRADGARAGRPRRARHAAAGGGAAALRPRARRRRPRRSRPGSAGSCKLDGDDFIGRAALLREQASGAPRRLVGLELREPGDRARTATRCWPTAPPVGEVTSGTQVADARARHRARATSTRPHAAAGHARSRSRSAAERSPREVVPMPFYRRRRSAAATAAGAPRRTSDVEKESAMEFPRICDTRQSTSGCRSRTASRRSASPTTRRRSSATSSSSSCPRSATRSTKDDDARRRRVGQGGVRRLRAGQRHGDRGQRGARRATRARQRGSLRRRLDGARSTLSDPAEVDELMTAAAVPRRSSRRRRRRQRERAMRYHAPHPDAESRGDARARSASRASRSSSRHSRRAPRARRRSACRPGSSEHEVRAELARARGAQSHRTAVASSSAPAPTRTSFRPRSSSSPARRVRHRLHAVPARGEPGHAAGDLRVPDVVAVLVRPRGRQRQHVRRRVGGRRGGADGAARAARARRASWSRARCTRSTAQVIATYSRASRDVELVEVPFGADGTTDAAGAPSRCGAPSCLVLGYPNFFGVVEDLARAADAAHAAERLLVTATTEPLALALAASARRRGRRHRGRRGAELRHAARRTAARRRPVRDPRAASCAACRAGWSARPSTATAGAATC